MKTVWMDGTVRRYDVQTDPGERHPQSAVLDPLLSQFVDATRGVQQPESGSMAVGAMLEAAGYVDPAPPATE